MKVLDNDAICDVHCEPLERDNPNYKCESASDGNEALIKAKVSKPDIVTRDFLPAGG